MIDRRLDRVISDLEILARWKPRVDYQIAERLAECDTRSTNETGIRTKGAINDPVGNAVVNSREGVMSESNAINDAVVALEANAERLRNALKQADRIDRDANKDEPVCWWAECSELVEHYTRSDQTIGYRTSGLCARHRKQREREERDEREVA